MASNAASIAQAHCHAEAWFRAVYAGDEPVGFVMLDDTGVLDASPAGPASRCGAS